MNNKKRIIVIGGGFAGIQLVSKLDEDLFDILLIDKLNHHQFQPLFYQVAAAQVEPSSISFPLRNIFHNKKNVQIRLATVTEIDRTKNQINTTIGKFDYDYLVIAFGCKTNFFGNNQIEKNVYTLKTTTDATDIRNHILMNFEEIVSSREEDKEALFNLVIVGAGATGVELAGAFAEIKRNILPKDYVGFDFSKFKIFLIEGSKHTLNNMSDTAKAASRKYLEKMGITILTETYVKDYDGNILNLSNNEDIKTKTVIWAAGVKGNEIEGLPENSFVGANRIKVDRYNKVFNTDNIFAIGDIAIMETPKYPRGHPQVANVAINQAKVLAQNLKNIMESKPLREYEYKDLGSMATIGRNKAVADFAFVSFKGYIAWGMWMFLHLMLILSVKNKMIIFINWVFTYINKDTSLRLILNHSKDAERNKE